MANTLSTSRVASRLAKKDSAAVASDEIVKPTSLVLRHGGWLNPRRVLLVERQGFFFGNLVVLTIPQKKLQLGKGIVDEHIA